MRRRLTILLTLVLIVVGTGIALTWIQSGYYVILPDKARPTDPLVKVPGEASGQDNDIYMVDVRVGRATLLERLLPPLRRDGTLIPARVLNPEGVSDQQRRRSSLNDMTLSQKIAITVALRELGREVKVTPNGAEVVLVQPGTPADGKLEVGDLIVEANGEKVTGTDDLRQAFADVEPGDDVHVTVRRDNKEVDLTLGTQALDTDPNRAVVGVQVQDADDFEFPVDIKIDAGGIGGPSAGLAFALDIVDELGDDIDRGRTIVATGELDLDGNVHPIGGVKQKAISAKDAGADIFLVPDGNYEEAKAAVDDLRIVPVSTFAEALSVLKTN